MTRFFVRLTMLGLLAVSASPLPAVIQQALPLQEVISVSTEILVTKVENLDPDRPSVVLTVEKSLKGKSDLARIPINLKGDAESDKAKQVPELLKRLAPELPVVVFIQKQPDGKRMMLAYSNGTWFQVLGQGEGKEVRWGYTHCEIYLRRTYKGTTAEMEQVVADALSKKKRPPAWNPKEPAGLGPVVSSAEGPR